MSYYQETQQTMTKVSTVSQLLDFPGHIPIINRCISTFNAKQSTIHFCSTRTYLSRGGRVTRAEWAEPAAEWVEPAAQLSAAGQLEPQIPV